MPPAPSAVDEAAFEAERLGPMRTRVVAIAVIAASIWALQFVLWEPAILPVRAYSLAYRGTELVLCTAQVVLAIRARRLSVLQWGTTALMTVLTVAHGLALLVVTDDCVVGFTLTMEWGQMVTVLAAMLMFRPAVVLLASTLVVGAIATAVRAKWDTDFSDHAVLAGIYAIVAMHVRSVDRLRRREFETRKQLERANEDLRKNDEARSRLFVNLSHDFRTPLALIHAEAEIAGKDGTPEPRRSTALARIRLNAASLAELVNQLLELARLDAGRAPRSPKTFDLVALARRVVAQFQGAHGASGVDLVADGEGLGVHADPGHVHRILANLIDNATRQVRDGGGRVRVEVRADGGDVVVDVVDEGPGLRPEHRARIFERFATFDQAGGLASGIGLPVARELAELEGGTLDFVDGAAQTTFRLRLPRSSEALAALPSLPPAVVAAKPEPTTRRDAPEVLGGRRAVLVVEDHPEMRGLLVELLQGDFAVVTAATLADANAKLEEVSPAAILSDVMLPDGDGYELLERVRASRWLDDVPVLLVSALGETEQRVRGLSAGADDYIAKPFSGAELVERVRSACERARKRALALETQRRDFQAELHDGVTASLSRAAMLLNAPDVGPEHVARARNVVGEALAEARGLLAVADGAPVPWARLVETVNDDIEALVAGFSVDVSLDVENDASVNVLSAIEQHTLRRVLREALTNALKHAGPRHIGCRLRGEGGRITLHVEDDGRVAEPSQGGRGLAIARRRLEKLGGEVRWARNERGGSVLSASFPHAHAQLVSVARASRVEAQT